MSLEKSKHEAERWLSQARSDLRAAENSLAGGSFDWACFQSQQAGEKALKAYWYHHGKDPWGHSLLRLVQDYPGGAERTAIESLRAHASALDKLYIPTRYPNGLPDLTPAEVFGESDARQAIDAAREVIDAVARRIEE